MKRGSWLVFLVACGGSDTETTLTACEGAGDPAVQIGKGTSTFVTWEDGDHVPIEQSGRYGFWVSVRTTGIDTTDNVTLFLRYSLGTDPETTDAGASVVLNCGDDGAGTTTVFAPLDDALQTATVVGDLDGTELHLTATLTDTTGDTASGQVDLVLDAP